LLAILYPFLSADRQAYCPGRQSALLFLFS